jgi:outer membrane protein OmpA-like peptidoglycan-associated protein
MRTTVSLLAALAALPALAFAQDGALQLEQFEAQLSDAGTLNQPVSAVLPEHSLSVELYGWYVHRPLQLVPEDEFDDKLVAVPGRMTGELHVGYGFLGWGQVAVGLPWSSAIGESQTGWAGKTAEQLTAHALGDLRIGLDFDLINAIAGGRKSTGGLGVGVGVTGWMPTGTDTALAGEPLPRGEFRTAIDWTAPFGLRVGGNVGFHLRQSQVLADYRNGHRFRWGASVSVPLVRKDIEAMAVAYGAVPLDPLEVSVGATPVEVLAGVRYKAPFGLRLQLAGGAGVTPAVGAPAFRIVGQVGWNFGLPKPIPPVGDDDNDGVPNDVDRCPLEPETSNAIRDGDGCPEANVVEEHISTSDPGTDAGPGAEYDPADIARLPRLRLQTEPPDDDDDVLGPTLDVCPGESEDVDGFEDEDGCPDPDNDGDGILDAEDLCPLVGESPNGLLDDDGCPEFTVGPSPEPTGPDTDGDGVVDAKDGCPLEPETANGVRDFDGCPEDPAALDLPGDAVPFGAEGGPQMADLPVNGDGDGDGVADLSDACPTEREDRDGFEDYDGCPDPDNDGDGVIDRVDRCPLEGENVNGVIDVDGCPDIGPDADGDGVDDADDRCPLEPENVDGVRDEDGCPEAWWVGRPAPVGSEPSRSLPTTTPRTPGADSQADVALLGPLPRGGDLDGDGLDHHVDDCPEEPEDLDGVLDGDGCPDPDDDADGVPDADDGCPLEAETANGYEDEDGCPDVVPTELEDVAGIVRGIRFRTGSAVLLRSSNAVLSEVRDALKADEGLLLEISGHTDSTGSADINRELSERRASAVAAWLRKQGVAADRLTVQGFGPDRPVATNDTDEGRAANRRVELSYTRKEASP